MNLRSYLHSYVPVFVFNWYQRISVWCAREFNKRLSTRKRVAVFLNNDRQRSDSRVQTWCSRMTAGLHVLQQLIDAITTLLVRYMCGTDKTPQAAEANGHRDIFQNRTIPLDKTTPKHITPIGQNPPLRHLNMTASKYTSWYFQSKSKPLLYLHNQKQITIGFISRLIFCTTNFYD